MRREFKHLPEWLETALRFQLWNLAAHFTDSANTMSILTSRSLRLSSIGSLEDVFDSRPPIIGRPVDGRWEPWEPSPPASIEQRYALEYSRSVRVACFCLSHKKNNEFAFLNHALWALYGEASRGACLLFSRQRLISNAKAVLATMTQGESVWGKSVEYWSVNQPPPAFFPDGLDKYSDLESEPEGSRVLLARLAEVCQSAAFIKSTHWTFENEWRLAVIAPPTETIEVPIDGALRGIVLGAKSRFPDDFFDLIDVPIYILHLNADYLEFYIHGPRRTRAKADRKAGEL